MARTSVILIDRPVEMRRSEWPRWRWKININRTWRRRVTKIQIAGIFLRMGSYGVELCFRANEMPVTY